jgi:hypothetical protein
MKGTPKIIFKILTYTFAIIGLGFTAVFVGMRFGLFNVQGSIGARNSSITGGAKALPAGTPACVDKSTTCNWTETPEWAVVKGGLGKDAPLITKIAAQTGTSSRMIASVVVPEQTRFFTAEREVFKRYFEPLKILGSLSQFSLGVSGIKQDTAVRIEKYANDPTSEFHPGPGLAELITYAPNANHDTELYKRLTDAKDHTYQYIYTAIYIREIEAQWQKAGYDVTQSPEVIVTLFNIGFDHSKPNASPHPGGASITTGGKSYTYGELGAAFYHSVELTDVLKP